MIQIYGTLGVVFAAIAIKLWSDEVTRREGYVYAGLSLFFLALTAVEWWWR